MGGAQSRFYSGLGVLTPVQAVSVLSSVLKPLTIFVNRWRDRIAFLTPVNKLPPRPSEEPTLSSMRDDGQSPHPFIEVIAHILNKPIDDLAQVFSQRGVNIR